MIIIVDQLSSKPPIIPEKHFFTLYRRITEETILEYEKYAALTEKMSAALMARKNSQIHSLIFYPAIHLNTASPPPEYGRQPLRD